MKIKHIPLGSVDVGWEVVVTIGTSRELAEWSRVHGYDASFAKLCAEDQGCHDFYSIYKRKKRHHINLRRPSVPVFVHEAYHALAVIDEATRVGMGGETQEWAARLMEYLTHEYMSRSGWSEFTPPSKAP